MFNQHIQFSHFLVTVAYICVGSYYVCQLKSALINFGSGLNEKAFSQSISLPLEQIILHYDRSCSFVLIICSIHHAILLVLFKIFVCPSRVPLTEHNLPRIRATNISRLANMSRPSSATQKPSACVPKNRKQICPPSTRIELQPTSNRFVCQIIICSIITKCYMSERLLFVHFCVSDEMDRSDTGLLSGSRAESLLCKSPF